MHLNVKNKQTSYAVNNTKKNYSYLLKELHKFITHALDIHENPMGFAWHFSKQINNYVEKRNWMHKKCNPWKGQKWKANVLEQCNEESLVLLFAYRKLWSD